MPKNVAIPISKWSEQDRPREKLIERGKSNLSDAELLALLIGSGTIEESALDLSRRILSEVNHDIERLSQMTVESLQKFKGIGSAKAVKIVAALELSARKKRNNISRSAKVQSSETVYNIMEPEIGELDHEEFWIIYLNNSNRVLRKSQLSKGGITGTLVDIRLVLKEALELSSTSIILAHNHPSGTLIPSQADKDLTYKLKTAAASMDINVLDHLILSSGGYFSFADSGLL